MDKVRERRGEDQGLRYAFNVNQSGDVEKSAKKPEKEPPVNWKRTGKCNKTDSNFNGHTSQEYPILQQLYLVP